MRRREFIALAGASVAWPFTAIAQQAGRMYRVGLASPVECGAPLTVLFTEDLQPFGFVKGQNFTIDCRKTGSDADVSSQYGELVKDRVDAIVVYGAEARAAQTATRTIPIVVVTDDMLGAGLVTSLARPTGNMTGVSILASELDGKRQEILIEAMPGLRRMAALADPNMISDAKLNALQEAARARNIELSIHRITKGDEIVAAIDTAHASRSEALNVLASPLLFAYRRIIMDRAAALRLPAIYEWAEMAEEEGGFAAYGPSLIGVFRDPYGRQAVQLLRGIKVADIPVQVPTKFELVINLKTAKAMGVTVPEGLLVRADKVIE